MRNLFLLVALLGLIGIAFGVLDIVRGTTGPHGLPFSYENSGGPGPMLAGLVLVVGSLYLRSVWRERR